MTLPLVYRKSKGKTLSIVALPTGKLEVRVPLRMSLFFAKTFMLTKTDMLKTLVSRQQSKLLELKKLYDERLFEVHDKEMLARYKKEALLFVEGKLQTMADETNFPYKKIQIKNTSSRWGSCSSRGTLSFHYKILFLPQELQKYLLVHELCHLKEMNHSKRFWSLVKAEYPEYEEAKKRLKALPIFS